MKILFLVRRLSMGGAERQLVLLANELARRGVSIVVAAFYGGGACLDELDRERIRFVDLKKRSVADVLGFQARLFRLLREERPDVVHGYNRTANLAALISRLATPEARLIWGVRDSNMEIANYGATARVCEAMVAVTKSLPHAVIANSAAAADLLRSRGFAADRVHHVPNGISERRFRPDPELRAQLRAKWGVSDDERLIGVVGRIEPMKDQAAFVRAAGLLAPTRPDCRFVCVGKGWGPSEYLESVRRTAVEVGVADRMIWAEPESEPRAVYNALDVVCSSSRYGEGFPNVVGEAMACGRPLVVTHVGDSPFVVGDCWPSVPADAPEALAEEIGRLLDRPDELVERGERGRRRIQESFSVAQLADRTVHVIAGIHPAADSIVERLEDGRA